MGLKILAELGLDGTGFIRGMHRAEESAHGVLEGIKGFVAGAVGIYTVERAISKTVETATELVNVSQRLGIGPEKLQVLRKAAEDAGTDIEKLSTHFEKLEVARQKALTPGLGGQQSRFAFQQMGVGPEQLRSMGAAQLFMGPMANKMQNTNPADVATVLREIFGKGFGEVLPVLKTDFGELEEELKKTGAIMDTETAVKLKNLGEELSLLGQIITSQLGPAMVKLAEFIYSNILNLGKTTSGAAGFYGAGTAGMGTGKAAGTLLKTAGYGAADIFARVFQGRTAEQSKAYLQGKLGGMGFNVGAARSGAAEAQSPWEARQKQFAEFLDKMAKKAAQVDNPKPPEFHGNPLQIAKKALEVPSDSLTRVGNFLGGSQNALQRLAQRRTDLLQQIAKNTRPGRGHPNAGGAFGNIAGRHSLQVPEVG
jgi:hypothetical protein